MKIASLLSIAVLIILLLSAPLPALADRDPGYFYDSVDVDILIRPDSDLQVSELQNFRFQSGDFHGGYRSIPTDKLVSIDNVEVWEGATRYPLNPEVRDWVKKRISSGKVIGREEYGYATWTEGNRFWIGWWFPTTMSGSKAIEVKYTAHGALRIHDTVDRLYWKAIWPDRTAGINSATITVHLPGKVDTSLVTLKSYGAAAESRILDDGVTVVFSCGGVVPSQEVELDIAWPHGLVAADAPSWQAGAEESETAASADRQRKAYYDGEVKPYVNLIMFVLALLVVPLAAVIWLKGALKRRGQAIEVQRDYGPQYTPPDNTPPSLVELLVSGRSTMGLASTIFDLARRGIIRIDETCQKYAFLTSRDFVLTNLKENNGFGFEEMVSSKLASPEGGKLSSWRNKMPALLKEFNKSVEDEALRQGLFTEPPSQSMKRLLTPGLLIMVGAVIVAVPLTIFLFDYAEFVFLPFAMLAIAGIVAAALSPKLISYTAKGAQEAAAWKAFGKYLGKLAKDRQLATGHLDTWDSYLPLAVIFGLAQPWISRFASMGAPAPSWFYVYHAPGSAGTAMDTAVSLSSIQSAFNTMVSTISGSAGGSGGAV